MNPTPTPNETQPEPVAPVIYLTRDRQGNSTRGFEVLVPREGKKAIRYPAKHSPLLTGREALEAMEELARRGFDSYARTNGHGGEEILPLENMRLAIL